MTTTLTLDDTAHAIRTDTPERSPAERLRTTMAAVKLSFTWLGVRRALAPDDRSTAARVFDADRELLSASKTILDIRDPAYRAVTRVRSEVSTYWRTVTIPFPEAGIRLINQNSLGLFASTMGSFRERLHEAARGLADRYDLIKEEARRRLGRLFDPGDYPPSLEGLFDVEVSYPTIEPPGYLMALHPEVFRAEQARVRERFEAAIELAEQGFATELGRLMSHLAERLSGTGDGKQRIFRDSAIENIREFVTRFARLNVRSSRELDELVQQAEATVSGIVPQELRDSRRLREAVAEDARRIEEAVELFMAERPRRAIQRRPAGAVA